MTTKIINGDCLVEMKKLPKNSIDAILCDPPYGLEFMGKEWDKLGRFDKRDKTDKSSCMNRKNAPIGTSPTYIGGSPTQEWHYKWAKEAIEVAKPGAHMLAFGGTRTHHRLMVAIEDAGWEIRDTLMWVYGSGFPKSLNIGKQIDKSKGLEREVIGNGLTQPNCHFDSFGHYEIGERHETFITTPASPEAKQWDGWGTALKPAWEPIILARKPINCTFAENVLKWGTGGINIDGCRVGSDTINTHNAPTGTFAGGEIGRGSDTSSYKNHNGRFPANFLHDGSEEVMEGLDTAARFFYCAKASSSERNKGCEELPDSPVIIQQPHNSKSLDERYKMTSKNDHPTVKPVKLLRYLARLITPPNGTILDPFAGSGSTGVAANEEGFNAVLIEPDSHYCEIIKKRCNS